MSWLSELMPPPHIREPLTIHSFFQYLLPAFLCYYVTAVLVLIPDTFKIRLTILPISLWTCFAAATRLDLVKAYNDERLGYINHFHVLFCACIGMRIIIWSFQRQPFWRVNTLAEVTPEFYTEIPASVWPREVLVDAFDLLFNLRGCGWNWSRNLKVPPETRSTSSITAFAIATLRSFMFHLLMLDFYQYALHWISPTLRSPQGASIFDATLPPFLRYSKSTFVALLNFSIMHGTIQTTYNLATLVGVLVFQQDLSLWPPAFDNPWLSSSVTEGWARRWHQLFRDVCISLGGKPMFILLGRGGSVLGTFLISAVIHHVALWGLGNGTDTLHIGAFFVMNGVGVILEHGWKQLTGRRVNGWCGRIWAYAWFYGWGNMFAEAWATKGMMSAVLVPRYLRLTTYIFHPLVG